MTKLPFDENLPETGGGLPASQYSTFLYYEVHYIPL
jgi:hypothetical protein